MKYLIFVIASLIFFSFVPSTNAHSGRTDSSGGHNCSSTSIAKGLCTGYHYHNGGSTYIAPTTPKPTLKPVTPAPTTKPTIAPTIRPTMSPTATPTITPSPSPTEAPTPSPEVMGTNTEEKTSETLPSPTPYVYVASAQEIKQTGDTIKSFFGAITLLGIGAWLGDKVKKNRSQS